MKTDSQLLKNTSNYRKTPKGVLTNIYNKQVERSRLKGWPMPSYTLREFHEMYLVDKKFIRLFNEWVRSGYLKNKKPSFDRIDCTKPYTASNIHVVTWEENRYKQRMEVSKLRATAIKSINLVTNEETIYSSVSDAVRKTGYLEGGISSCLCLRQKSYKGFIWMYIEKPKKKIKLHIKNCECCGKEFIYKQSKQRFCSRICGSIGNNNASKYHFEVIGNIHEKL